MKDAFVDDDPVMNAHGSAFGGANDCASGSGLLQIMRSTEQMSLLI
jgi:hypothetical protein